MKEYYLKEISMFVAMVVRNNMEDFHCKHLTDKQMKELNPLVRNGIYTALHILFQNDKKEYDDMVQWTRMMIPDYWEQPKLTKDFKGAIKFIRSKDEQVHEDKSRGKKKGSKS